VVSVVSYVARPHLHALPEHSPDRIAAMPHRLFADAVLLLHFAFLAFAVAGALLVARWPRLAWLHVPALAWGAYVVLAGEVCPLTPLENALRHTGSGSGYEESFIEHYLLALVYPGAVQGPMGRGAQVALGAGLLVFNAIVYAMLWRHRHRAGRADDRARTA
jgi:hypothetical protein